LILTSDILGIVGAIPIFYKCIHYSILPTKYKLYVQTVFKTVMHSGCYLAPINTTTLRTIGLEINTTPPAPSYSRY